MRNYLGLSLWVLFLNLIFGTVTGDSKWFLSIGLGKENYFNKLKEVNYTQGAFLVQMGLRYMNKESIFRDLELGLTSSSMTFNRSMGDINSLGGVYVKMGFIKTFMKRIIRRIKRSL